MKNKIIAVIVFAFGIIALAGVFAFVPSYSSHLSANVLYADSLSPDSNVTKTYTCPMHPDVISDKQGECPKCGMDLILKEDEKKQDGMNHDGMKHGEMNHKGMNHDCMKDGAKKDEKNDAGNESKGCKGCMNKH